MKTTQQRVMSVVWSVTAISVLLAVFALYTQPDFLVTLANQVWSCF